MKLYGRKKLVIFAQRHADVRSQIKVWVSFVADAHWHTPLDVKAWDADASILEDNCVVFNLKGKKYRLKVQIAYRSEVVYVLEIGTHPEYDKW